MKTGAFTLYRKILYMSNLFLSSKLDAWRSLLEAYSFHQAAILAKERRQTWSNIVATLRIVAYVQGNARGRFGRLVGQYVISRSTHSFTQTLLEIGYCYRRHGPTNYYQ